MLYSMEICKKKSIWIRFPKGSVRNKKQEFVDFKNLFTGWNKLFVIGLKYSSLPYSTLNFEQSKADNSLFMFASNGLFMLTMWSLPEFI